VLTLTPYDFWRHTHAIPGQSYCPATASTQYGGGNIKPLTKRRRACSKVQSQKTCNYDNYDHDADDVENVHWALR
jgi:hypothetical protein